MVITQKYHHPTHKLPPHMLVYSMDKKGVPSIRSTYTVPSRKRAHYGISAHPPLWAQVPAKV